MTLTNLRAEMIAALKAGDKNRLGIIRLAVGEVKNKEIELGRDATEPEINACIERLLKQTRETLELSRTTNDDARTATLATQVEALENLLPQKIAGDTLATLIDRVVSETGATTKRDMGRVMGRLTELTAGAFDKPAAAAILKERLS